MISNRAINGQVDTLIEQMTQINTQLGATTLAERIAVRRVTAGAAGAMPDLIPSSLANETSDELEFNIDKATKINKVHVPPVGRSRHHLTFHRDQLPSSTQHQSFKEVSSSSYPSGEKTNKKTKVKHVMTLRLQGVNEEVFGNEKYLGEKIAGVIGENGRRIVRTFHEDLAKYYSQQTKSNIESKTPFIIMEALIETFSAAKNDKTQIAKRVKLFDAYAIVVKNNILSEKENQPSLSSASYTNRR